jgi:hypothetical protein
MARYTPKDAIYETFVAGRGKDARRIKRNLAKVEAWKKKLAIVMDPTVEPLVKERLDKAFALAVEQGIDSKSYDYNYAGYKCKYSKGEVKLDLVMSSYITTDSSVELDYYVLGNDSYGYSSRGKKALRIHVGKIIRVTNSILPALLDAKQL